MNGPRPPAKAVVLAGGPGTTRCPLSNVHPSLLFPVADGRPLAHHLLGWLRDAGFAEVAFSVSEGLARREELEQALAGHGVTGVEVTVRVDRGNRGPAGALKDLRDFVGEAPLAVFPSHLWPEPLDLPAAWRVHETSGAAATVLLETGERSRSELEGVQMDADGAIREFRLLHASTDHRRRLRASGIYLFEPGVLDLIESDGYFDIREQLLAELQRRGQRVQAHLLEQPLTRVDDLWQYLAFNRRLLLEDLLADESAHESAGEPGVHVAPSARVDESALIVGPVVIGEGCEVEPGARIIGPVLLCAHSRVGRDALLRDAVVWPRADIGDGARFEYGLLTAGCRVAPRSRLVGALVDSGGVLADRLNQSVHEAVPMVAGARQPPRAEATLRRLRGAAYRATKRAMDLALPLAAAPLLLPLAALVALAIKLDSPGPVLYRQRRCGRDGREFDMWKFRTMVVDADRLQVSLLALSGSGGPMFKMQADPRITRVGRLLRRSSLDELPQLWCVLAGHMSLVGPRPLAMKEMAWAPRWRDIRLRVKPGLTGLWQVNGRSALGFDGWVENDIRYVRNQSLALDLHILARTLSAIVRGSGAM